jgi:hypothetical protein
MPEPTILLQNFESLGEDCEFGIVQRTAGIEPLGLLRWASVDAKPLVEMLNRKFKGVGQPRNTVLRVAGNGEYALADTRYFGMHTFVNVGQVAQDKMLAKMLTRLAVLKDKLIEDLTMGEKIFVYKGYTNKLSLAEMRALVKAIRKYGPGTLFCVQPPERPAQDNTVQTIESGLIVGYLGKLTIDPLAARDYFDDWVSLCRKAYALVGQQRSNGE